MQLSSNPVADFLVPDVLRLPAVVRRFDIGDESLYVAPEIGAAILVDALGRQLFEHIERHGHPRDALLKVLRTNLSDSKAVLAVNPPGNSGDLFS